eukprot:CAMPEP_0185287912 /NCGR_PEP_ID=MMETSP1363-20130426/3089_1 /TAXON_ID=38817 /ORGANISM="Gephyrocapsa oceanica, Strain RCC1303" /LENGTH=125 /DNA_ID=CAMNT_0027883769 /DNA_START=137 /DNA_END=512 /DNA_ORIENTATION=+
MERAGAAELAFRAERSSPDAARARSSEALRACPSSVAPREYSARLTPPTHAPSRPAGRAKGAGLTRSGEDEVVRPIGRQRSVPLDEGVALVVVRLCQEALHPPQLDVVPRLGPLDHARGDVLPQH